MNLKTAARRLGVHYQTAYRWVRSGQLVAVKVGAGYEISDAALDRFQAQRIALERIPDVAAQLRVPVPAPASRTTRDSVLATLDRMLDAVTLDGGPVVERAVRIAADVVGNTAILLLRDADGEPRVVKVAHSDPVMEVRVATIAPVVSATSDFATMVMRADRTLVVPQVPQREVRNKVASEMYEHLISGGCFSLIGTPVRDDGVTHGALLVARDAPGEPHEIEDVDFVEALAARITLAQTRARRFRDAAETRRRVLDVVSAATSEYRAADGVDDAVLDGLVEWAVADDPDALVAILDIEGLRHRTSTKAYADMFGRERSGLRGQPLEAFVDDPLVLAGSLECVLADEIDLRTVEIDPIVGAGPVMLQITMVRCTDATRWGVVVVGHVVPRLAPLCHSVV